MVEDKSGILFPDCLKFLCLKIPYHSKIRGLVDNICYTDVIEQI